MRFPRKIAQEHIAADLGVSRETISRRLNEWERSGLLRTGARSQQIEILDYQRISRLASLRSARSRAALERSIDDIDAAIACGDLIRARNIGLDILRYYPSSPELHHRTALAAARSGRCQRRARIALALRLAHERRAGRAGGRGAQGAQESVSPHGAHPRRPVHRRGLWRGQVGAGAQLERRARCGTRGAARRGSRGAQCAAAQGAGLRETVGQWTIEAGARLVRGLSQPVRAQARLLPGHQCRDHGADRRRRRQGARHRRQARHVAVARRARTTGRLPPWRRHC